MWQKVFRESLSARSLCRTCVTRAVGMRGAAVADKIQRPPSSAFSLSRMLRASRSAVR